MTQPTDVEPSVEADYQADGNRQSAPPSHDSSGQHRHHCDESQCDREVTLLGVDLSPSPRSPERLDKGLIRLGSKNRSVDPYE